MGEVWRAHDTEIDRVVALKMLLPHFAQDPDFDRRFRREARAAARLDDPHVVPIYDVGEIDGRLYVTMRLINGVDLATLLDRGPLDASRAVSIVEQIASALHSAHEAGLVHRDVKPSNILLGDNDFAYLIDFGIARGAGDTALTSANTTMGTWAYMAPERFSAGEVQASSDVYALACVLYQCLTGELPYPGEVLEQIAVGHMVAPPPRPSLDRDTVPVALDRVIETGLAKEPSQRYPSAVEMAAAARQAVTYPTDPAYTLPWQAVREASSAPTQMAPSPAPAPSGKRRRAVLIGAVAGVVLLIGAAVVAAVTLTGGDDPNGSGLSSTAAAPTSPAPAPNTGPFTGIYTAAFGPATALDGTPFPGATPSTGRYAVRSVCDSSRCAATASQLKGDLSTEATIEFDEVGDEWLAVSAVAGQCNNAPAETWQVFRLQPRPDGSLTGEYSRTTSNQCGEKRTVTFTRIGDVDLDSLPDPADVPPRVVSPAEGLRGRYHLTRTFTRPGLPQLQADSSVITNCLRTGDRCMSYFVVAAGDIPLVFDGHNWVWTDRTEGPCPGGDPSSLKADAQFPLPQPPQNPVPSLTGHGTWVQSGSCAVNLEFDETFTRTGD